MLLMHVLCVCVLCLCVVYVGMLVLGWFERCSLASRAQAPTTRPDVGMRTRMMRMEPQTIT